MSTFGDDADASGFEKRSAGKAAEPLMSDMELRDWFAGQALAAITNESDAFWAGAAPLAYQYADAMLCARKQEAAHA